jgi:hypothetical protein
MQYRFAPALALAALCGSCGIVDDWRATQRFEELEAEVEQRLREVQLPQAVTKELDPPQPAARIAVTSDAIYVDNLGLIADWGGPVRAPEVAGFDKLDDVAVSAWIPLVNRRVDPSHLRDGEGGLLVNPLYDVLEKLVETEKHVAARTAKGFDARVNLLFDRDTPFFTAVQVLYTAGQSEYQGLHAAVVAAGMRRFVEFNQPRTTPQRDYRIPECRRPRIELISSGALFRLTSGRLLIGGRNGSDERLVLGRDGSCTAAGRVGGRIDLEALRKTIDWMPSYAMPCYTSTVAAEDAIPWGEVTPVLEILQSEGRFNTARLSRLGAEHDWDADCAAGIRPDFDDKTSPRHERPKLGSH